MKAQASCLRSFWGRLLFPMPSFQPSLFIIFLDYFFHPFEHFPLPHRAQLKNTQENDGRVGYILFPLVYPPGKLSHKSERSDRQKF